MSIEQAIETAMRWQEEFTWRQAAKAVSDFKHRREMAQKDAAVVWQTERKIAELQSRLAGELSADTRRDLEAELSQETAFRDGEAFESFFKHAELNDRISEQKHAEAVAMQRELLALEWFVREHCPHLLGDVPAVHVFGTLPDVAAGIAAMRRLEGALRGLMVSGSEKSTRQRKRRTKPQMTREDVEEHWKAVLASGNRDLILDYLTLGQIPLAAKIGCARNTLRKCDGFQNRDSTLRLFLRENS